MALPPLFLDELRARTPLAALIGRATKLVRSGRQWKGCCPFHGEKSPSFYVYEDHFHCFGCGAHGDAISFVMQKDGAGFMEAVETLARDAGLEVPAPSPQAAAAERRRHDLYSVLDAALRFYQRRLHTPDGRAGLHYLHARGLSHDTIAQFGLGWSGDGRGDLVREMDAEGIPQGLLLEAGLLRRTDSGQLRELFFNRVMFPIRDRKGRTISFGGRTLADAQPKYVNGPETAVFSKRRNLYGLDTAREGTRSGETAIAVEGYMDVIALHQAGLSGAVAGLGTALTAEQLEELWRLSPAPVLCFDGDAAGARAALKAMDTALPLLNMERSLRVAMLSGGEDPDSLVRKGGRHAFQPVIDAARPLVEALFNAMKEQAILTTPEGRATFRNHLFEMIGKIPDKGLAIEYRQDMRDRLDALRPRRGNARGRPGAAGASTGAGTSLSGMVARSMPSPDQAALHRVQLLTALILRHPGLLADVEEPWCRLSLPPGLEQLRRKVLNWYDMAPTDSQMLDSEGLIDHLRKDGLGSVVDQVFTAVAVSLPGCGRPDAGLADAQAGWWHFYGLMHPDRLETEIEEARRSFVDRPDEAQRRLIALCTARDALRRGEEQGTEAEA